MSEKEKLLIKGYVLLAVIILFIIVGILITQRLFTAEYPTHSDVFFMGVECGVLVVVLLVCLFLICLLLYRLLQKSYSRTKRVNSRTRAKYCYDSFEMVQDG